MKAYQTYRKSGVPWLDTIPATWKLAPIKRIFAEVNEKKGDQSYPLLSFSREKGLIISAEDKKGIPDDLSCYKILKKGQLLENRMQAWNGMFICADKDGCVSPDYSVFKAISTTNTSVKFYEYVFRNITWVNLFANASKGIGSGFNRLYTPQFGAVKTIIPSLEEQNAIVSYLNKKCAEIDELVSRRQAIIERLKELKQSIIAEAVTKGLNPDVPMKDSGAEWMGAVPAHWARHRISHIVKIVSETGTDADELLSVYLDRGVIRHADSDGMQVHKPSKDMYAYQKVQSGNLVCNNQQAWRGSVGVSNYNGRISPAYFIFQLSTEIYPQYANYFFRSKAWNPAFVYSSKGIGSIQRNLYLPWFKQISCYLPVLKEQKSIVAYLDKKCAEIDTLISRQEQIIEKLKELKTSTIAHVVTGKVDVRDTL